MANLTEIMISCFGDDGAIEQINKSADICLERLTRGNIVGGHIPSSSFCSYAASYKAIGSNKVKALIETFLSTDFENPEYAVLFIYDEGEGWEGIITKTGYRLTFGPEDSPVFEEFKKDRRLICNEWEDENGVPLGELIVKRL